MSGSKYKPDPEVISLSSDSYDDASAPRAAATLAPNAYPARVPVGHEPIRRLDDASRAHLQVAIATSPEGRVREAFAALVYSVPALSERVFRMLVAVPTRDEEEIEDEDEYEDEDEDEEEDENGEHRMIPRWRVCANCGEEYDAGAEREPDECKYHPGELEVNEDAFVDWDEDVHGPMDTPENRESYPDNFIWTCCDLDGTKEGCTRDEHEPEEESHQRKRTRLY
ncbi:hypothetical protein C8Q77DRAFT_587857 [Trametes polyzona]|nr:hypothetical protein C8Q77DRAFT_587857 [Trametes polyzona]